MSENTRLDWTVEHRELELKALAQRVVTIGENWIRHDERTSAIQRDIAAINKKMDEQAAKIDAYIVQKTQDLELRITKIESDIGPIYKLFWAVVVSAAIGTGALIWSTTTSKQPHDTVQLHQNIK